MKLQGRAVEDFLRAPSPGLRAVLLYGPDEGLVRERAGVAARKVVPDAHDPFLIAEIAPEILAGNPSALLDEANSLSLVPGRRLIHIREATDKVAPSCTALAKEAKAGDALVVIEAGDLTPRSPLRKLFEAEPTFACIACYADDARSLEGVIRDSLAAERIKVDADAVGYLAQALLGDRALVRRALEKLALYAGPNGHLSLEDAMAATGDASAAELDDPARAAADGNRRETDRALQKLLEEGTSSIALLRAGQQYFRRLHIARSLVDQGVSQDRAMEQLRPPVFFKTMPQFRRNMDRWRLPMITMALDRLIDCETAAKRTNAPDELLTQRTFLLIAQMLHSQSKAA